MKLDEKTRHAIVSLGDSGHSAPQIVKMLPEARLTPQGVNYTLRRYRETGATQDRKRSGRPRSEKLKNLARAIKKKVDGDPMRTISQLGRDNSVHRQTVQRLVQRELDLSTYRLSRGRSLSAASREKRPEESTTA